MSSASSSSSSHNTSADDQKSLTYASSGVDIDSEAASVRALITSLKPSKTTKSYPRPPGTPGASIDHPGGFSGLIEFGSNSLALCTDGVGTKLMLASTLNNYSTVGIDCVAMNVNDLICIGAEPLAFVDYIAAPAPNPQTWSDIGKGLAKGCELSRVTLCGGETASLPGMVTHVDMSGTALGSLEKGKEINGKSVKIGDLIIGLPSSGIHSNGYSMVRKAIEISGASLDKVPPFKVDDQERDIVRLENNEVITLGDVLMNPTRIYVEPVIDMLKTCMKNEGPCGYQDIHGIVHITGGGLSNFIRLNHDVGFNIEKSLKIWPEFEWIQSVGDVGQFEMWRTFNMGMGLCIVVDQGVADKVLKFLETRIHGCGIVGKVTGDAGVVRHLPTGVVYDRY